MVPVQWSLAFDPLHSQWSTVLKKYQIADGKIRYELLKKDVATDKGHPLSTYLADIQKVTQSQYNGWAAPERMAFLINAYNAFTVKLIIDHYPVQSIKKIRGFLKGPWGIEFFSLLDGSIKKLDPIEHDILRPQFKDYRVHAAVNCASLSCPRLHPEAFVGSKLNAQLETAFVQFLSDPTRNRFGVAEKKLYLSEIFKWFDEDFETAGGYLRVIESKGPANAKEVIQKGGKVEWLDYDWSLNDAISPKALASEPDNS